MGACVVKIWQKTGKLAKDMYAFMDKMSTAEAIMVKKMMAEDARRYGKELFIGDIDFSKAYDSTERYAKDISLLMMGMNRRGRRLWQYFDTRRRMRVLTAYGLTDVCRVECGAWGQGAEESPYGWLALMSWMCKYIEHKVTTAYEYLVSPTERVLVKKVLFADDGSYFQPSFEGGQQITHAVCVFSGASGTIVQPKKSFGRGINCSGGVWVTRYGGDGEEKMIRNNRMWAALGRENNGLWVKRL